MMGGRAGDALFMPDLLHDDSEDKVSFTELLGMTLPPVPQQQQQQPQDYTWACRLNIFHWSSLGLEVDQFMRNLPSGTLIETSETDEWKGAYGKWVHSDGYTLAGPLRDAVLIWTPTSVSGNLDMLMRGQPEVCAVDWVTRCTVLVGDAEACLPSWGVPDICLHMSQYANSPFWAALGRLHEHMTLCAASYGFLTSRASVWLCARVGADGLAISSPVPRASVRLGNFWWLMYCALNKHAEDAEAHTFAPLGVVERQLERRSLEKTRREVVKRKVVAGIRDFNSKSIHKKIQFWDLDSEFVQDRSRFSAEVLFKKNCVVERARWKLKPVVLKIRDLSDSREDAFVRFLAEIMVYKSLKQVQGDAIPRLLGYGFASGCMLGVLVLSEGGTLLPSPTDPQDPPLTEELLQKYSDEAARVVEAIHGQGLLHGDMFDESLLIRSRNPLRMTAVSLCNASRFRSSDAKARKARDEEVALARGLAGDLSYGTDSDSDVCSDA